MGEKSRWTTYHDKRGCGERVREIGDKTLKATERGSGVRRRRNRMI